MTALLDLRLDVEEVRLDNGLTILLLRDPKAPVFTIMLWVPAGVRTEAPGQSGISHYLEHCYSLGSSKLAPREIDRVVQALGGQKNAFTSCDFTAYYESMPKAALDRIVEIEADRFAALTLPADRLASELDVVREERRLRTDNSPGGLMVEKLISTAFERHPYHNPVIGWPDDLAKMTRDTAVAYYRTHYVPANATYVLVGDFDPAHAKALFRKHFGEIPGGERPRLEPPAEPEQTAERRGVVRRPSVKLPRIAFVWKVPGLDHPDTFPLMILQTILFEGDAARADRLIKRERQLATVVRGGHWELRDAGPFMVDAEAQAGVPIEDLERAIVELIADAGRTPATPGELERAKAQIEVAFLTGLETTGARARAIGRYHVTSGRGWRFLDDYCARIRAVTAADVQRVAATYFKPELQTVVHLLPESYVAAPSTAPAPGEPWGEARRWILPNGLTVVYQQVDALPTVAIEMDIRAGGAEDPRDKAGLSTAVLELLKTGTAVRDEESLAEAFATLGTQLGHLRGPDAVEFQTTLLARDFERALELIAEVIRRPAFAPDKFERVRKELLAEKASAASKPDELLVEAFYREVYAGTPYENPLNGTPSSLSALTLEDAKVFHVEHYRPQTTAIAIVGAVDPGRIRAAVERVFGDWAVKSDETGGRAPGIVNVHAAVPRLVIVDKPDQTQAHIRLGHPAIPRSDPDYDALAVAHYILGGAGLASRVTDVVRTKNGLAYSAATILVPRRLAGPFAAVAQTKLATAAKAIALMIDEMRKFRDNPIPEDELARAKGQYAGSLPFRLETNAHKASALMESELHGLGPDHLRRQIDRVQTLTAAEVQAAARKHIRPEDLRAVVVGPEAVLRAEIEAVLPS